MTGGIHLQASKYPDDNIYICAFMQTDRKQQSRRRLKILLKDPTVLSGPCWDKRRAHKSSNKPRALTTESSCHLEIIKTNKKSSPEFFNHFLSSCSYGRFKDINENPLTNVRKSTPTRYQSPDNACGSIDQGETQLRKSSISEKWT